MDIPAKWLVIGSIVLICSCVDGKSLSRKRRQDFVFPDDDRIRGFGNRAQFQQPARRQPPQQFFQPQGPPALSGFFQSPSRSPFPTPVLPGPPANINSPQESSTVTPDAVLTTPSPSFLTCFGSCPTTSEYNPICGTNQQLYYNQQKYDCAVKCGAKVQIWRRGSCAGLFPMMRG